MKNQNAIAQIAYIVTADYYTNGKPTTCKITVQPVNFDPARLIDWSDRISKTHIREVENFTTPAEAAKRMTEIIEAAGLTDVDLCGTISRLHPFYGLQVTAGATEATIDLESIMYLFFGYEGSHTLTFNMTDNKGRNAVATLQFNYGKGTAEEDPSIVCRQFDIDQPHTTQTGDEIDVDIKTASGIQAFVVSIISETLNEEVLAAVGLRPTFDLCNITDPEELAALTSDDIGFPVNDDVKGQTSMTFSVTKFTGMLSAFPGTHQFKLAVTNAEGSTTTKTLQLIVEQ